MVCNALITVFPAILGSGSYQVLLNVEERGVELFMSVSLKGTPSSSRPS
jgi:hypothetical protein